MMRLRCSARFFRSAIMLSTLYPPGVSSTSRPSYARRMKVTKHEHACQVIEKSGSALIIDPGAFTLPLDDVTGVVAIVITHEHADHWTAEHIERIRQKNPDARLLGPAGVAAAAGDLEVEVVAPGDTVEVE